MRYVAPLVLAWLMCGSASAQAPDGGNRAAPELGRLFFTAAERERLERERNLPQAATQPAGPAGPERVVISGLISRTGRPPLPVINGRILAPGEDLSGLRVSGQADGRVRISSANGPAILARPGQTVDLATGETWELFDLPGRRAAAKPETALPATYGSGIATRAAAPSKQGAVKSKRPRRSGSRGAKIARPKGAQVVKATPTVPARAPIAAPGPAIPALPPTAPLRP